MVLCDGKPGIIKVYNTQLQHLATIKHRNMDAMDVSFDVHQNFCVDCNNSRSVHVFKTLCSPLMANMSPLFGQKGQKEGDFLNILYNKNGFV